MKYTLTIEIDLPREQVVRLLADPAHLPSWLRGLESHEPVSGAHGQVGTVSRVVMQDGTRRMEASETITRREPTDLERLPRGTVVHYERELRGPGMWNAARERLTETDAGITRWESENEFRFEGVPMRVMARLMTRVFRRQSWQHMEDFKAFAEDGRDVREAGS